MSQKREIKGDTAEARYFSLTGHLEEIEQELAHLAGDGRKSLYLTASSIDMENTEDGGMTEEDGEAYWEMMIDQASAGTLWMASLVLVKDIQEQRQNYYGDWVVVETHDPQEL